MGNAVNTSSPLVEGSGLPPNTMYLGPSGFFTPYRTSIRSANFAGYRCMTDKPTDTPHYYDYDRHIDDNDDYDDKDNANYDIQIN